jgi:single-strand DNA-binding protein
MNKVILIGRLTKDPEVRQITGADSFAVARYTLAVDRFKKGEADFINCVAFKKSAEFADKYLHKGMKIAVTGHIQTGSYSNKEGKKVYTTEVAVEDHEFCEKKTEEPDDGFVTIPDEDSEELPFE